MPPSIVEIGKQELETRFPFILKTLGSPPGSFAAAVLDATLPLLRSQAQEEMAERLLSDEGLTAAVEAHGGSLIPHEEAMMREALQAALKAIADSEEGDDASS